LHGFAHLSPDEKGGRKAALVIACPLTSIRIRLAGLRQPRGLPLRPWVLASRRRAPASVGARAPRATALPRRAPPRAGGGPATRQASRACSSSCCRRSRLPRAE